MFEFTRFSPPLDLVKFYPSLPFPPFETHFNPLSSTAVYKSFQNKVIIQIVFKHINLIQMVLVGVSKCQMVSGGIKW